MNQLFVYGLCLAVVLLLAYLACAAKAKKRPDLRSAIEILVSAVSIAGAVRLSGFVFTSDFKKVTKMLAENESWWSLSPEDGLFLFIGGLALAWVSCQQIWEGFAKLSAPVPSPAPAAAAAAAPAAAATGTTPPVQP